MLSASSLLLTFTVFLFYESSTLRDGFIYSKEIPLSQEIIHFSLKDSEKLVIQHPSEIITAKVDKPYQIEQKIVQKEIQNVPFSLGQAQKQLFFVSNGYLNGEKSNSSFSIPIKELTDSTPIIQVDGINYFFNPKVSSCVLLYDMSKKQLKQGPLLPESLQYGQPKSIAFNRKMHHLFIGLVSNIYIVNMVTQAVIQELYINPALHQIIINQSQNSLYVLDANRRISFYLFENSPQNYQLYFKTPFTNGPEKSGLYYHQSQKICHQISTKRESITTFSIRTTQSSCLQYNSLIVAEIPGVPQIDVFRLGQDRQHIYSIKLSQTPVKIYKYLIKKNNLQEIESKKINFLFPFTALTTFVISGNDLMIFKNQGNQVIIWDFKNQSIIFSNVTQTFPFNYQDITLAQFHPKRPQLYLCYTNDDDLDQRVSANQIIQTQFCSLKLDNQANTFECKIFLSQIKQIVFAHGNIYLLFHSFKDNIIILDEITKQIISAQTIPYSTQLAVVKDELFGIKNSIYANRLISFNSKLQEIKSIQIPCSAYDVSFRHTDSELIAICYEQEHLYNTNLQYKGSTIILTNDSSAFAAKQTSLSYYRFNQQIGYLITYVYRPWKISFINNLPLSLAPSSDYIVLNPTQFLFYHLNGSSVMINHCRISDNKLEVIKSVGVGDSKGVFFDSCLKIDCTSKILIVSYLNFRSGVSQDTLFYSLDDFQLHSYHRDTDHQGIEQYQVPYLNCKGQLFQVSSQELKIFQMGRTSSVNVMNLTKDLVISASFDGKSCLVFGSLGQKHSLSIWQAGDQHMVDQPFNSMPFSVANKIFIINKIIVVFSINQLYFGVKNSFIKYKKNISHCQYYSINQIVCLTLTSQLIVINQDQTEAKLFEGKIEGKYNHFFLSQDSKFLILSNQNLIKILRKTKSSNLFEDFQTFSCHECDLRQTLITSQGSQILAYSSKNQSIHYWKITHCPPFSQIIDGFCRCTSQESNNQCFCKAGEFADGQSCSTCSFFCDQCSESAGSCDSFSKTGIAFLTSFIWIATIGVAFIFKCLMKKMRKWKQKSFESIQSQLISQDGSIND